MSDTWWMLVVLAGIVLPAAVVDVRCRRIPNELCLAGILLGLSFNILNDGVAGALGSVGGFAIAFFFGFLLWVIGWFGAGDAKLVSAVGAIVGLDLVLQVLAGIGVAGGVVALLYVVTLRVMREPLGMIIASAVFSSDRKEAEMPEVKNNFSMKGIPYAIPVAFGSLAAIVYMY